MLSRTHLARRLPARGVAVLTVVCLASAAAAGAQEADPTSTTTSTTTSSTSTTSTTPPPLDPGTTEPAPAGGHPDGGEEPPPDSDSGGAEAPPEAPPENVAVPPPAQPPAPSPIAPVITRVLTGKLRVAQKVLRQADAADRAAEQQMVSLEQQLAGAEGRVAALEDEQRAAVERLRAARALLKRRMVAAYLSGGDAERVNALLDVADINELARRAGFVSSVNERDRRARDEYLRARRAVTDELMRMTVEVERIRRALETARLLRLDAAEQRRQRQLEVDMLKAGGAIAVGGFVFPVGDPHRFGDSFGAPRMPGTPYEHAHQGTDIFAPMGTPLHAVERGVITKVGTDVLGGLKLWLVGTSGARYYYAHLSGFAEGIAEGLVVEPGHVVGYVGDSGNARGTSPHLHFEIHPGGGPAINPYPILKVVDEATKAARATSGSAQR